MEISYSVLVQAEVAASTNGSAGTSSVLDNYTAIVIMTLMQVVFIVTFVIAVFGVLIGVYIHRRNMSFEGTVTDKDIQEEMVNTNTVGQDVGTITLGNRNSVRHIYKIKVQTPAGKIISWQVSEGKYQIINIGDKVIKRSGTTDIEITPATPSAATTPNTPMTPPTSNTPGSLV